MDDILEKAVERMLSLGAEYADARQQTQRRLHIQMVDSAVRSLNEETNGGVCLRARMAGSWGYASTVMTEKGAILEAASKAAQHARLGTAKGKRLPETKALKGSYPAQVKIRPDDVPLEEKLALVKDLDKAQRIGPKVVNANSIYSESIKSTLLVNSFRTRLDWEEIRGRVMVQTVASDGQRIEGFYNILDGSGGFELFKGMDVEDMGRGSAQEAVKMLEAKKCPSGYMTCISDPMISGLLAHEVMGHASEGDEIVKRRSFLSTVVGEKVASERITMVDDGTLSGAHGYIPFDDEGTPSSRTTIIEDGVYQGYMHSLETAAEMGARPTGNGRAQDHSRRVFVRMTNTFFEAGDWKLDEMIEDVDHGVLTDRFISGMEDPVGGGFEGKALRGFLIENGRLTDMVRGFTLTGKALEILKTVDAVGDKVSLDGGNCGKGTEDWVPVSSGGPFLRSKIILGGG
jgi:TldD protein